MRGMFREVRAVALVLLAMGIFGFSSNPEAMAQSAEDAAYYDIFKFVGELAVTESVNNMIANGGMPNFDNLIVMSNAGYAEFMGLSTQSALDGLSEATGTSRGKMNLLEIHSASHLPLWFAIYDKVSGLCSYLQVNPALTSMADLFSINTVEKINADHLYANTAEYTAKLGTGIFGGNEFRIVTIMNAVAKGAPVYAARAFEFHDHYCPGVTSGIIMVNYLKKQFPLSSGGSYFVQAVQPWCKEDALMVLLNATPGKGGYSVLYSTAEDRSAWKTEAKDAANIIYRYDAAAKKWDGVVLGFTWATETGCDAYGSGTIGKLCSDLWYLEHMDEPELFVKEILRFELPEGVVPKDWARPGVDPMQKLGLVQ
ncbi:MAG: FmdE family protein [Desulfococcaceae bacterium]